MVNINNFTPLFEDVKKVIGNNKNGVADLNKDGVVTQSELIQSVTTSQGTLKQVQEQKKSIENQLTTLRGILGAAHPSVQQLEAALQDLEKMQRQLTQEIQTEEYLSVNFVALAQQDGTKNSITLEEAASAVINPNQPLTEPASAQQARGPQPPSSVNILSDIKKYIPGTDNRYTIGELSQAKQKAPANIKPHFDALIQAVLRSGVSPATVTYEQIQSLAGLDGLVNLEDWIGLDFQSILKPKPSVNILSEIKNYIIGADTTYTLEELSFAKYNAPYNVKTHFDEIINAVKNAKISPAQVTYAQIKALAGMDDNVDFSEWKNSMFKAILQQGVTPPGIFTVNLQTQLRQYLPGIDENYTLEELVSARTAAPTALKAHFDAIYNAVKFSGETEVSLQKLQQLAGNDNLVDHTEWLSPTFQTLLKKEREIVNLQKDILPLITSADTNYSMAELSLSIDKAPPSLKGHFIAIQDSLRLAGKTSVSLQQLQALANSSSALSSSASSVNFKEWYGATFQRILNPGQPEPSLEKIVTNGTRNHIKEWSANRSITELNKAVAQLPTTAKTNMINKVLDLQINSSLGSASLQQAKNKIVAGLTEMFSSADLGFYMEVLSYTPVRVGNEYGFGYYGGENRFVGLNFDNLMSIPSVRNLMSHELLHSFNDEHHMPQGAMDEGAAIWIFKSSFPEAGPDPTGFWAEGIFGTKLFYRDIGNDPNYPLYELRNEPMSNKGKELYNMLQNKDHFALEWDDPDKINHVYEKYWSGLNRNVPWEQWLNQVREAITRMNRDYEQGQLYL